MNNRREGLLRPLKDNKLPKRLIFFDTETRIEEINPNEYEFPLRLGCVIYVELNDYCEVKHREVYRFNSVDEYLELIQQYTNEKCLLRIFAHNVGFDVRVLNLPYEYDTLGYKSEPPIINERTFIWDVHTDKGTLLYLDTANFGVYSVDQLGKDLGYDKGKVDFDNVSDDELYEYCKRDTEILEIFMLGYIRYLHTNELGAFKVTLASQSLAAYRTKFLTHAPYIHNNVEALKLERLAYHGGRVEAFFIGEKPQDVYYNLDVNSMYPFSMKSQRLPRKLKGYSGEAPIEYLPARMKRSYCIADVTVTTDKPAYCILKDGKLVFPTGTFRAVLHDIELRYALEHKHIIKLHQCATYEPSPLFDDYVDFFYASKEKYTREGNKTWRYISKLFLNSLYGKFGQTQPLREPLGATEFKGVWRQNVINMNTGKRTQEICWYGMIYKESREGETAFSSPAIAGAITAIARMTLWNYMEIAGRENVFYGDTDSLWLNKEGYEKLLPYCSETELGKLKLEKTAAILKIFNCKDYSYDGDEVIKGVPKKAIKHDDNLWSYMQFQGFVSWLNDGAIGSPRAWNIEKRRRSRYNKGVVQDNGDVRPFVLTE